MTDFIVVKEAIQARMDMMIADGVELFEVEMGRDELPELYLASFPEGTNPMFRERTEHDCNCCRSFIRNAGNIVAIVDGEMVSVFDVQVDSFFQVVMDALSAHVKSKPISNVFRHFEANLGRDHNHELGDVNMKRWEHFHYKLPNKFVITDGSIGEKKGHTLADKQVLQRSLTEITPDAVDIVLDLIDSNSIYRGAEHLPQIRLLQKTGNEHEQAPNKEYFFWQKAGELGGKGRFKNSVIGTLLVDISEGVDLTVAVKKFEDKVAPQNYKRTSSLITQRMIDSANTTVQELGIEDSLPRREAVSDDLTVNNVLFADRTAAKGMGGLLDTLAPTKSATTPNLDKVQEVGIEEFISKILPKATSVELMMDNRHTGNLVSLVSPQHADAKGIFKWGNNFSWSYNGEVTDSMKEQVRSAGGNVEGDFRFTHSWNHNDDNKSLMDIHVFFPDNGTKSGSRGESHDSYGNRERVGWNNRSHRDSKGVQDVDYVDQAPTGYVPIENISFPDKSKMPEGTYVLKIHNWSFRGTGTGFKAEIEVGGNIHQFEYNQPMKQKEWVTVAEVVLKNGVFTVHPKLESTSCSKEVWGINTNQFQKVSMVMNSPNHWDGEETGNKHYFFMMEGCNNPDKARGFYNEFLSSDLHEHRKVFEVLGGKMKAEKSTNPLCGLGFSSTVQASVLCKVSGSYNRVIKINF